MTSDQLCEACGCLCECGAEEDGGCLCGLVQCLFCVWPCNGISEADL